MKVRSGDNVMIIAGKDRGKSGAISKVLPKDNKVIVTGINIAKKHLKPSRKNPHGGILDIPKPIDRSNVIVLCPHCGKPTKIAHQITNNEKFRVCKFCKGSLDQKEKNVKA